MCDHKMVRLLIVIRLQIVEKFASFLLDECLCVCTKIHRTLIGQLCTLYTVQSKNN